MKIAINGFGRIGRLFFRQAFNAPGIEIVAINDLGEKDNLIYLLKYDSVYGRYDLPDKISDVKFIQEKDPAKLPWKDLGVDVVLESTGCFETFEKAKAHLDAGAKRVILSAPAKDAEGGFGRTILMGINDAEAKDFKVTSNASCTTNASSPVIAVLAENPGIEKAVLNTIHAMTNTQTVVDTPVKGSDMRRGRAASQNLIPSTTGAAIAVTKVFKELEGKFDGIAIRCPIITGSLADITFISKRKTSAEEINKILKEAAESPRWKGILKASEDDIVSSDIIKEPYGAIVDLQFTKVIDGNLVKVLSWYDNEWGYVAMLIKHIEAVKNIL
jgi:glyceraldehyde 3-phosphate dehydrogenase